MIFDIAKDIGPAQTNTHIHGVKFDVYTGRIWMLTGDGPTNQSIRYTDDDGTTWHTNPADRGAVQQCTSIYPLPDCVLFGSDSRIVSCGRLNRPDCGFQSDGNFYMDLPQLIYQYSGTDGTGIPVATRAGINYKQGIAAYGFSYSKSA